MTLGQEGPGDGTSRVKTGWVEFSEKGELKMRWMGRCWDPFGMIGGRMADVKERETMRADVALYTLSLGRMSSPRSSHTTAPPSPSLASQLNTP